LDGRDWICKVYKIKIKKKSKMMNKIDNNE